MHSSSTINIAYSIKKCNKFTWNSINATQILAKAINNKQKNVIMLSIHVLNLFKLCDMLLNIKKVVFSICQLIRSKNKLK
jgi:hypothetical protein